jgi:glutathione S-transferase
MITITTLNNVPPFAQGLVRDLRVRWALEEAGLAYEEKFVGPEERTSPAYLRRQPFGQCPVFEEDGLVLFESGAIVLHIGERSEALLPRDPAARARAVSWVFASLNTVEIVVGQLAGIDLFYPDEEWAKLRRPGAEQALRQRLGRLSEWLGNSDYLEGEFSAGDLMMSQILRILRHTNIVESYPNLQAYRLRCEARPAFQRALRAHMEVFLDAA